MPPSTKRRNRRRDVKPQEPLDTDVLDSSPTQRTAKKRKVIISVLFVVCCFARLASGSLVFPPD